MAKTYVPKRRHSDPVAVSREARLWIGTIIGTVLFLANEHVQDFLSSSYNKIKDFITLKVDKAKSRKKNK